MSEKREPIADIVAELRVLADSVSNGIVVIQGDKLADRIEAAWKREKAAIESDALSVGGTVNAARARELFTKNRKTDNSGAAIYTNDNSGDRAKMREAICTLRTALKEIRNDVLDMVMNHKSEDPDSYAHGLCLSIGGACDMALNSTKEFEKGDAK